MKLVVKRMEVEAPMLRRKTTYFGVYEDHGDGTFTIVPGTLVEEWVLELMEKASSDDKKQTFSVS